MIARRWLLGAVLSLVASAATAQTAAAPEGSAGQDAAPAVAPAAPPATPAVRRPRSRSRSRMAAKPPPLEPSKQPATPQPPRLLQEQAEARAPAPVPNRSLDVPAILPEARASLGPTLMNRNLPSRGQAAEGGPTLLEEKLFQPGPGARLSLPFSY